jgi:hypothetical protein
MSLAGNVFRFFVYRSSLGTKIFAASVNPDVGRLHFGALRQGEESSGDLLIGGYLISK